MDKYRKVKIVGKGNFGHAVLVQSVNDRKLYIMKIIDVSRMERKQKEEALNEVYVLKAMRHPYIVTYRESFMDRRCLCIVMDFADGGDMYSKIAKQKSTGKQFNEEQVLDWFVQICLALKHVHDRKILHRDLKTQNIFLTSKGDVKMGDFGIARVLQHTYDCAQTAIGTPYYLSPEICQEKPYNQKSDIWSLGCILYEMLTLRHAFDANSMKALVLKILRGTYPAIPSTYSQEIRDIVAEMLQKDPQQRPSIRRILEKDFLNKRIGMLFSRTVKNNYEVSKSIPPGMRPPSGSQQKIEGPPQSERAQVESKRASVAEANVADEQNLPQISGKEQGESGNESQEEERKVAKAAPLGEKNKKVSHKMYMYGRGGSTSEEGQGAAPPKSLRVKKAVAVSEHAEEKITAHKEKAEGIAGGPKVTAKNKYEAQEKYFKGQHDGRGSKREAAPAAQHFQEEEEKNKSPGARAQLYTPQKPAGGEADIDPSEQENFINSLRDCLEPKRGAGHKKEEDDYFEEPEDQRLQHHFTNHDGKPLELNGVSQSDSVAYRIQALRAYLEEKVGEEALINAYKYLLDPPNEDESNKELYKILGKQNIKFVPMIYQMIVCEDSYYSHQN